MYDKEIEKLRARKEELEREIDEIKEELSEVESLQVVIDNLDSLEHTIEAKEIPDSDREDQGGVPGIEPVDVDTESGRPPRGARAKQIRQGVDLISRKKDEWKAGELFDLLKEADPSIGDGQRAYLYSKLDDLKEEGYLEKVARGTWTKA